MKTFFLVVLCGVVGFGIGHTIGASVTYYQSHPTEVPTPIL